MVDIKTNTTQRFSFNGWSFKTWAVKNKDSIKLIVSGVSGILSTLLTSLSAPYSLALAGVVTVVFKLLLDTIDYWQSE